MSDAVKILVADDEPNLRRVLTALLKRDGHEVHQAADGDAAIAMLGDVDVVISDLRMPSRGGMDVLAACSKQHPHVPVILMTAYGSVAQAVEAMKVGAFDYVEKPFDTEQIRVVVGKAVAHARLARGHVRTVISGATASRGIGRYGLVGTSAEIGAVYDIIERVADTPSTVLITGESGTGKELVARALHESSGRAKGPFIKINCAAIPKNLMESELFGYERGAFTGATTAKPGRFELAHEGTLFLDEIGEIPVEMQVKLLRAIQESEFERVGGLKTIKVDVRLVTATNRELDQEIARGNFREDLFYRLNVVPLHLAPLRQRRSDLTLLVPHIIDKFNERLKKSVRGVTDAAMATLTAYHWPGNIRELENVLERTMLFCNGDEIDAADLPAEVTAHEQHAVPVPLPHEHASGELSGDASLKDFVRAEAARVEREFIGKALEETGGNVTQAAKLLRISRKSLQLKMKDLGLRIRDTTGE